MKSAASSTTLLRADRVGHEYDDRLLFEPVQLAISPGELITLVGPNGVGKSTLLRCLAGLIEPSQGKLERTPGFSCAYLGHGLGLRLGLSGRENLRFALSLYGAGASQEAITMLSQEAGLERVIDAPVLQYSAGQRKRLALTRQALIDQALWLLDEPASNLDADGRDWMAGLCQRHLDAGGAIVMAHHGALPEPLRAGQTFALTAADPGEQL